MAMLKFIVDFAPLLIGAEGARLLRVRRGTGDPAGAYAPRRLPDPPAESESPERKSTAKYNTAFLLEKRKCLRQPHEARRAGVVVAF